LDRALKHYKEALEIDEQLGDLSGKSTILSNIGGILYKMRDLDGALKHYQEALEIAEQLSSPNAEIIKSNIKILKNKMNSP